MSRLQQRWHRHDPQSMNVVWVFRGRRALLVAVIVLGCGSRQMSRSDTHADCELCVFQRPGNLSYIVRRALGGRHVPAANASFGHCFVCTQCPGDGEPTCRGWWPQQPDGGDYEGDEGRLLNDNDESWVSGQCHDVSRTDVVTVLDYESEYAENTTYQVVNKGNARGCLGFCVDVANQVGLSSFAPGGNLTIPGRLRFSDAEYSLINTSDETPQELMSRLVLQTTTVD